MSNNDSSIITVEMLSKLKADRDAIGSKIEQAKGSLVVIDENINKVIKDMEALGVTPETSPTKISDLGNEIKELYQRAEEIIGGIQSDIDK